MALLRLIIEKLELQMKGLVRVVCVLLTASMLALAGCSSSPKTQVVQMNDESLSRDQILQELAKLDQVQRDIDSNKGATGTNVAAFLFWLPGLAYTYYDASEATKLVEQRRSHLTGIYNKKFASTASHTHGAKKKS